MPGASAEFPAPPAVRLQRDQRCLSILFTGDWVWRAPQPDWPELDQVFYKGVGEVRCFADDVKQWDSSLLALLLYLRRQCEHARVEFCAETLPPVLRQLLDNVPRIKWPEAPPPANHGVIHNMGLRTMTFWKGAGHAVTFIGECAQALAHVFHFPKALRWPEVRLVMQECGPASLGIVGLISFLTGCILAWQGALQLRQFGAEIYVADLVGVALAREMGPIMVAIVISGRIGASFAAHLATMEASEEIDALRTWGFSPVQFLALPRIIALTCMMPLLVLYSDLLGMAGGLAVGTSVLGLSRSAFLAETWRALHISDLQTGLLKSIAFGLGVACIGCASGLKADRSAEGVGLATTSSVVKSILYIIVVDAIFGMCSQP